MGDALDLPKDKRHRSSSSLAPIALDDTRSERKLNRASIPEADDQFSIAEGRCDDLQQKIDLIKSLRRKKKLKRRSTLTPMIEQPTTSVTNPFIFVKTQPKKKLSQQASRMRRIELPNPARNYLDPATVEQHRMVNQIKGYNKPANTQANTQEIHQHVFHEHKKFPKKGARRARADGDNVHGIIRSSPHYRVDEDYDLLHDYSTDDQLTLVEPKSEPQKVQARTQPPAATKKWNSYKDTLPKVDTQRRPQHQQNQQQQQQQQQQHQHQQQHHQQQQQHQQQSNQQPKSKDKRLASVQENKKPEQRPLVELFSKNRNAEARARLYGTTDEQKESQGDDISGPLGDITSDGLIKEKVRRPRNGKFRPRSRRYEMPTVASQMKQAGVRYYYETANYSKIPFVVSKSTAPSHNIGVNIQQVLNGIKIQQPLSGIPLTIAHHMGLGHVPKILKHEKSLMKPMLSNREINTIKAGSRMLRLPSYKYVSYKRLLSFYTEGDGMVPKFLRAINRPHYFYTSMYNLQMNREDVDGATSKGRAGSQEAKQTLVEYASLYKEYENLEKSLKENYDPELERRKEEMAKELAAREDHIRRVVYEFGSAGDVMEQNNSLRASASIAEDGYRYSTYKLHGDNPKRPKE